MTGTPLTRQVNHAKCDQAYELRHRDGLSYAAIGRKVDIDAETVRRWLNNPARFDPVHDEVALKRAIEGERRVYDNLTLWERDEFWSRIAHKRRTSHHREWCEWESDFSYKIGLSVHAIGDALAVADELD